MATTTVDELFEKAMTLPPEKRMELLDRLTEHAPPLADWERQELSKSIAELERGEVVSEDEFLEAIDAPRAR